MIEKYSNSFDIIKKKNSKALFNFFLCIYIYIYYSTCPCSQRNKHGESTIKLLKMAANYKVEQQSSSKKRMEWHVMFWEACDRCCNACMALVRDDGFDSMETHHFYHFQHYEPLQLETHLLLNRYVTRIWWTCIEAFVPSPTIHLSNDSGQI